MFILFYSIVRHNDHLEEPENNLDRTKEEKQISPWMTSKPAASEQWAPKQMNEHSSDSDLRSALICPSHSSHH